MARGWPFGSKDPDPEPEDNKGSTVGDVETTRVSPESTHYKYTLVDGEEKYPVQCYCKATGNHPK